MKKHYGDCPKYPESCRCDEVDLSLRLSPEAQLDAMWKAEHQVYLIKTEDPGADWDGCPGCGQRPRYCCCPGVNFGDAK